MEYSEYTALRNRAMDEGWHHWQRISNSRDNIKIPSVDHCVAFEVPGEDGPMKVLHPSPRFIGELMAGGIHPPISAHHNKRLEVVTEDGTTFEGNKREVEEFRKLNKVVSEKVVDNHEAHLFVAHPMTYNEAFEYCMEKDLPYSVWAVKHNRELFKIVKKTDLPDRSLRNSWKLAYISKAA